MADTFLPLQAADFSLAGSGCVIGATSITLKSMTDIDGNLITMSMLGDIAYMTLEPGNGALEEQISFAGITQNANGTATLTTVKHVLFESPYTQSAGVTKTHAGSTTAVLSNTSGFYNELGGKDNDETVTGLWTFPDADATRARITSDTDTAVAEAFVTLGQLSRQAISGAANASTTVKGIVELATQAEVDARSTTGATGALLVPTPERNRTVLTHDMITSGVGTDAYAITCVPAVTAYSTGDVYYFKADVANTGACTLNVNGLGAKTLLVNKNLTPPDGYIKIGSIVQCVYDNTNMQIISVASTAQLSQSFKEVYGASSGGTDTYAITVQPVPIAYAEGQVFIFKADVANTGAASLNVNALGALNILRADGSALATNDIVANQIVEVAVYDGTTAKMLSPIASAPMYKNGDTTKNAADASTTQNIAHGLARIPRYARIKAIAVAITGNGAGAFSETVYNGTTQSSCSFYMNGNTTATADNTFTINTSLTTGTQAGVVTFDATNIIITWTKTGSPTGSYILLWEAQA